jgi:hypothetical protein
MAWFQATEGWAQFDFARIAFTFANTSPKSQCLGHAGVISQMNDVTKQLWVQT